jgi:hypothetical protein
MFCTVSATIYFCGERPCRSEATTAGSALALAIASASLLQPEQKGAFALYPHHPILISSSHGHTGDFDRGDFEAQRTRATANLALSQGDEHAAAGAG